MIPLAEGYTIKIRQFEGPFDLLLFFIERDEIDILDIPVAKITEDFLNYIRTLENLNLDVASEFILVAATLMRIKAKMLLPRPQIGQDGTEIDPREELSRKLVEYRRFKEVAKDLWHLEEKRRQIAPRGNRKKELRQLASKALVDVELESLTLFKLFKAFEDVMNRMEVRKRGPRHIVYKYQYTIEEQREHIINTIKKVKKASFQDIFAGLRDRIHAIVTFLSLLELINLEQIKITQGLEANNFWVQIN